MQTMGLRLKYEGSHPHCTDKRSHVGSGRRVAHFIFALEHQNVVVFVNSMTTKLMGACSQISAKHTFKKLSFDTRSQKCHPTSFSPVTSKNVKISP